MSCIRSRIVFAFSVAFVLIFSVFLQADSTMKMEHFDKDPGWDCFDNRLVPPEPRTVTQDFGYSRTNHAGRTAGEIGGVICRSVVPAYYAQRIAPRTLGDPLSASGSFSFCNSDNGDGVFFGWFNSKEQGFRPVNFLGFRIEGEGDYGMVHVDYTTGTWKAGGVETPHRIIPDGTKHTWKLVYDPSANGGEGTISFILDGKEPVVLKLDPGHKTEGARFDRFGMFNVQKYGGPQEVYFDDITCNGKKFNFDIDPGWEGKGNRTIFVDRLIRGRQDFGYSNTSYAGGEPGEIGGTFWRSDVVLPYSYYADKVGPLTLDHSISASGKLAFTRGATDSGMMFGWFNSSKIKVTRPEREDAWTTDFLGIVVEGPSALGHCFRAVYVTPKGARGDSERKSPIIRPDSKVHNWSLTYDPKGGKGHGLLRVTLDKEQAVLELPREHREAGSSFDRFGFITMRPDGNHVFIYLDDITYTVSPTTFGEADSRKRQ